MSNKFVNAFHVIGQDFKKVFDFIMPWLASAGAVAISLYAPQYGPLYNATVQQILTTEAKFAAIGQSKGTGVQKLSDVFAAIGPLVSQGLKDLGKDGSDAAVQQYISSIVTILNAAPVPEAKG